MNKGFIFFFFCLLFFSASHTDAALLYIDPSQTTLHRSDTLKLSVRLDTDDDECVNVVDAVIHYSENIEAIDISRGASIMSMWVEDPVINHANRTISFAGGVPNGYCGRIAGDPRLTNVVVDLLFQSPGFVIGVKNDTNIAEITFDDQTQVLLNDGYGTAAPLSMLGASIELSKTPGPSITNQWKEIIEADEIEPEEFSISLENTTNAYSDRYFIVFNTTDKQSGIDHYEVIEESLEEEGLFGFKWGREDAPWKEISSPYVIKDQSLNSTIRVKAVDKAGNEYIASYIPDEAQRTISAQTKVMISIIATALVMLLVSIFAALYLFLRRRKKMKLYQANETEESEDEE